VAEATEDKKII